MKDVALSMWKWIAVAILVGTVGGMLLLGIGRRRGTRAYRWRLALWTLALSLLGGTVMMTSGCEETFKPQVSCYDTVYQPVDLMNEDGGPDLQSQELQATCYKQADTWREPDEASQREPDEASGRAPDESSGRIFDTCYLPPLPDAFVEQPDMQSPGDVNAPDVQIMRYEDIPPDVKPQTDSHSVLLDIPPTCYFAGEFPPDTES